MLKQTEEIFITIATCSKGNSSELLKTCASLQSLTQNIFHVEFEHLMILSCYNTLGIKSVQDICKNYSDNVATSIIETEPKGISHAFNLALKSAQGYYITFLNAGDQIKCDSDCINSFRKIFQEKQISLKEKGKEFPVYYFDVFTIGKSQLFNRRIKSPNQITPYHFLKMGNPINHQSTLYPVQLAKQYPYPDLKVGMDYSVNCAMVINGIKFCKLPGILVYYDITGISAKNPFTRLCNNFKTLISEAINHRLYLLIVLAFLKLPFLTMKTVLQKLTYRLR